MRDICFSQKNITRRMREVFDERGDLNRNRRRASHEPTRRENRNNIPPL